MPQYEYKCPRCHWQQTEVRSVADRRNPVVCAHCTELSELQLSKTSFSLKGTGWARDGYGNKR
jgi:putative FmdB family regulatory protein